MEREHRGYPSSGAELQQASPLWPDMQSTDAFFILFLLPGLPEDGFLPLALTYTLPSFTILSPFPWVGPEAGQGRREKAKIMYVLQK